MKKIMILLTALLCTATASSQNAHELAFYGGTGLSALSYTPSYGKTSMDIGGQFGLNYHLYFTPQWGIGTGLGLSFYNAHYSSGALTSRYTARDRDNVAFEFCGEFTRYDEQQNATLLEIPVMARFRTTGTRQVYAAAGIKIALPLSAKYSTHDQSVATTGFYARDNIVFGKPEDGESFTHMGFSSSPPFTVDAVNEKLDLPVVLMLSAEVGVNWVYNKTFSFYTGAYIDYGVNNLRGDKTNALLEYNAQAPQDYTVNSVLTAQYTKDNRPQSFVDKVSTVSLGIKIAFVFDISKKTGQ
jgi:hypothetical protein